MNHRIEFCYTPKHASWISQIGQGRGRGRPRPFHELALYGLVASECGLAIRLLLCQSGLRGRSNISSPETFEREVRALTEARQEFPDAATLLVTETEPPREVRAPEGIRIVPVW